MEVEAAAREDIAVLVVPVDMLLLTYLLHLLMDHQVLVAVEEEELLMIIQLPVEAAEVLVFMVQELVVQAALQEATSLVEVDRVAVMVIRAPIRLLEEHTAEELPVLERFQRVLSVP